MRQPEAGHAIPPEDLARLESDLTADLRQLDEAWQAQPASETPARLLDDTLARLRREGLLETGHVRVDWRRQACAALGVAAALLLVFGLWQARERLAAPAGISIGEPAWAEGLELSEMFASPREEVEVRLARVSGLLADDEDRQSGTESREAQLRTQLDRLAEDLEAF